MKLVTYNCNGFRSFLGKNKKGEKGSSDPNALETLITETAADIICLQETRCDMTCFVEKAGAWMDTYPYRFIWASQTRKGYSGVAILSKIAPINVFPPKDFPENEEGRFLCLEFERFYLINTYTPNSKPDLSRLEYRINTWEPLIREMVKKLNTKKPVLFCSDFNVAHGPMDIYSEKGHLKSHGYTPEERGAFTQLLEEGDLVDAFRMLHPDRRVYTWFSNFGKARERNLGWRIDTWCVSSSLKKKIVDCTILSDYGASDHRPVVLEINNT